MKILGAIVYLMGFLGIAFVIEETRIDIGGSFDSIVLMFLWLFFTMGIGSALMKSGNNDTQEKK